ncbi:SIMPL domain-containing protein [Galbibacter sp.]|uniref:SIMPL domain-containing protein n=1 Tax=Galbibacter sp. TaxID=2918471 RepID=UPI002C43D46A|nr:SIMPL domain-containing protein [Galbibacter sp.]HLV61712.1 SIMPL domain-containing protein [Galbibacter sp.]
MMKKAILVLTVLFTTMSLTAQETSPYISVSGEGIVKVTPDQVFIKVRVENQGKSAQEVKELNDKAIDKVLKYVKSMGVDQKDVNTEYINLNKNYDYQTKEYNYVANQSIAILLKDLEKYTDFTQGLLNAGINRIDGVEFRSTEIEKHKTEARIAAVKDAKKKAEELASALGMNVGKALYINESGGVSAPQPVYRMEMAKASFSDSSNMETIAVGEMAIKASVSIRFELK